MQKTKIINTRMGTLVVLGSIILVTLICLFPTIQNGWVNWDDSVYVSRNLLIQELNGQSIIKIFQTPEVVGLYHPLTLISLALDYHFWDLDPFGFHLTNLILHLINTCLVFFLFRSLKSSILVAGIVSLLFGMHPMHVESVAWISARKDVLYALFFLLSLIAYLKSTSGVRIRRITWLTVSLLLFCFSLLSKNSAFTLPFVLLLIDYLQERKLSLKGLLSKAPFFILSVIAMITAQSGQLESDSMESLASIDYGQSIFTGMYNVVFYMFKALIPINLSAFHPFPMAGESLMLQYVSIIPFLAILFGLYSSFKRSKKVFFGLVFFLVTIAPLLQIIPFGKAISSERYTYLPYLGLFYLIAVLIERSQQSNTKWIKQATVFISVIWIALIGTQTHYQSTVWENSELLWTQVIDQYPNSQWAYMSRGLYYAEQEELTLAIEDLDQSIDIEPFAQSLYERGILLERGNPEKALQDYLHSIRIDSTYSRSHLNIGVLMARDGKFEEAINSFETAIRHDRDYSMAYFNCATALKITGDTDKALKYYSKALSFEPKNVQYLIFRGVLLLDLGKNEKAIHDFSNALNESPQKEDAYYLRSVGHKNLNQLDKARKDAQKAKFLGYPISDIYLQELAK